MYGNIFSSIITSIIYPVLLSKLALKKYGLFRGTKYGTLCITIFNSVYVGYAINTVAKVITSKKYEYYWYLPLMISTHIYSIIKQYRVLYIYKISGK
jgi:hypothetical protein